MNSDSANAPIIPGITRVKPGWGGLFIANAVNAGTHQKNAELLAAHLLDQRNAHAGELANAHAQHAAALAAQAAAHGEGQAALATEGQTLRRLCDLLIQAWTPNHYYLSREEAREFRKLAHGLGHWPRLPSMARLTGDRHMPNDDGFP